MSTMDTVEIEREIGETVYVVCGAIGHGLQAAVETVEAVDGDGNVTQVEGAELAALLTAHGDTWRDDLANAHCARMERDDMARADRRTTGLY